MDFYVFFTGKQRIQDLFHYKQILEKITVIYKCLESIIPLYDFFLNEDNSG